MTREFQIRFSALILAFVTVSAVIFAVLNFRKELQYQVPYDGVWWVEHDGGLRAQRVLSRGPGERAGIKQGDKLVAINNQALNTVAQATARLFHAGVWTSATYSLLRNEVPLNVPVILVPADKSLYVGLRLIALIYLGIGLYVLLRRWSAPKCTHFYVFCLVSFVFYSFHYVGNWSLFDQTIYWANVVAWLMQPALFLHFALTFPAPKEFIRKRRWITALVYAPGLLLLGFHLWVVKTRAASELLRWNLDRVEMFYLATLFTAAAVVLWHTYRRAHTPILRQQLKWVTRGTFLAITPFTLFYVVPFLAGALPGRLMTVAAFSLVFLPLTFGYAIVRYRLMDVDIIFKRGMAYTLAAAAILGLYFGAVGVAAEIVHTRVPGAGPAGLVIAMIVAALLFEPMKNWFQERLDRVFYRKRYDYRRTLIEFGRDLSSETDLDKMLSSVTDRLSRTLLVDRVAVFLAHPEDAEQFSLAKSFGIFETGTLDLSFLARQQFEAGHVFYENTHQALRESPSAQLAIARLDLNYYIPCTVQNRTIAVLGLGKTTEGDFLSSEDIELLQTLAGYIGIAIQNACLYASLEQKVLEYERLKDFNENIVESISVGVLAVDLEDRIESWNSQMEVMYAKPRSEVLGRRLSEVFPASFVENFYRVRQAAGIHNFYKFRLETPAGDTRITNVAIAPLVTRRFRVIGRLIIVDDMTERVALEAQLSQADKMSSIGLLAAGVAHEVNTPLAVISSYAQMLAKQLTGDERKSALLEKITRQTFRASEIVNNLLNFSRTSGTEFSEIDINRVIQDTLALLEHQFKTARIEVRRDLSEGLPTVQGNAGRLQQVFLNLFLNAKDAMPGGGRLTVATANGAGVSVTVSDTGSGIAPENVNRIYDPFFTTKMSPQQGQNRGTGLGLSVTYGIIQEHAGKIRVESQPGAGTTFYLEFPQARKAVSV
ncbi:MAG TPA: ATP-binding protein [Terriglobales bacterium]|nr:ATP-binding protein [Terriglobales bacterium]